MPVVTASDGCRLHYDVVGAGDETVVLVPGLGGDGRFFTDMAALLAPQASVVSVDHRGGGRSDRPDGPYSIDLIAADVLAVLDALGIATAHFAGHSTGGAVVQTLAIDAPARLGRIVISGSWEKSDARFRALFAVRLALLEAGLLGEYQMLTHVIGYTPDYVEANAKTLDAAVAAAPALLEPISVTAARIRMLFDFNRSAELGRITAPTLVIGAADDELVPVHHSRAIAAAIPGARLETTTGGHFFPKVDPAAYAALVAAHCLPSR